MAIDPKQKFRRRSLAALTLALSATLTLSALAACAPADDTADDEEEETTTSQTDTQKIRNGNFEFYSEMDVEDRKEKLDLIRKETGASLTQVMLGFFYAQDFPVLPLVFSSNIEHLKDAMAAPGLELDPAYYDFGGDEE